MKEINYKLEKLNFDGPLSLLLHLIEKNKVDIYDIPIFEITAQYMEYIRQMEVRDMEIISDFLVMAATLMDIKAKMLLPKEIDEETGEEVDPRAELVERLIQYKKFKFLSHELEKLEDEASMYLYKDASIPAEVMSYRPKPDISELLNGIDLEKLRMVFIDVMKRKENSIDTLRADFGVIKRERISLGSKIKSLINYAREKRRFSFKQLLDNEAGRMEVVVSFLALLELMKAGKLYAVQNNLNDEIEIEVRSEELEDVDLSDIMDE
ncbi:MAG: segregation/condensation protein A [Eubacteriales bacterium]|nr:segregation/condensation protein A [Eubacteriales bacterium]